MRILLDENMPARLAAELRRVGHEVQTVQSLCLAGIDDGALLARAMQDFDVCFSKDADFSKRARESRVATKLKVLQVILQQKPQDEFVRHFMDVFAKAQWSAYRTGDPWP